MILQTILRSAAQFISVIFHPLLVLTYMLLLLLAANPYLFGFNNLAEGHKTILVVFLSTFLLPAFSVMLMKWLGMIQSLQMRDKSERIGPYIATGVFYLWTFKSLYANTDIPIAFTAAVLGATMALFASFFINIFQKISAHAVGMGGLTALAFLTVVWFGYGTFSLTALGDSGAQTTTEVAFMTVIFLSGIVGTARLLLGAHQPKDLYAGFLLGFATQIIAIKILL